MSSEFLNRRFWTSATTTATEDGGWSIALDGRPVKTPGKSLLVVPTEALAEAIAEEWRAQGERIDPNSMPFTRAANSAIEKVVPAKDAVVEMLAAYGNSDLLCYRAAAPDGLVARQQDLWSPWIAWAEQAYGARLHLTQGVMPIEQPADSLAVLGQAVARHSAFELTGLHDLITLSGSLVLGLAVSDGALEPGEAWHISRVDEEWQITQWGEDAEAADAAAKKAQAFAYAAELLRLVRRFDAENG